MAKDAVRPTNVHGVLGEPRGRILTELCGNPQTAVELAERVGTSSNAVRVHLNGLRDAGLVEYQVARRGVGKPTHVFALTAAAEYILSSAYAPTLHAIVDTLKHRLNGEFAPMLRESGRSLAQRYEPSPERASVRDRANSAQRTMESLGAPSTVEARGKEYVLTNACCPLSALTRDTPEICQMMEVLLRSTSGLAVKEHCDRGEHARCSFVLRRA